MHKHICAFYCIIMLFYGLERQCLEIHMLLCYKFPLAAYATELESKSKPSADSTILLG